MRKVHFIRESYSFIGKLHNLCNINPFTQGLMEQDTAETLDQILDSKIPQIKNLEVSLVIHPLSLASRKGLRKLQAMFRASYQDNAILQRFLLTCPTGQTSSPVGIASQS